MSKVSVEDFQFFSCSIFRLEVSIKKSSASDPNSLLATAQSAKQVRS